MMINKALILLAFLTLPRLAQAQDIHQYKVIEINDTFLSYYHLIKVISVDSENQECLNIISEKTKISDSSNIERIEVGKLYTLNLYSVYELMENYNGMDSIMLNRAYMRSVIIKGVLFISSDGSVHPYKSDHIIDIYYKKSK